MERKQEKKAKLVHFKHTGKPAIKVVFAYNEDDLRYIRLIDGRKFHKGKKCWTIPLSLQNVDKLLSKGFEIDTALQEFISNRKKKVKLPKTIHIPGLGGTLLGFQSQGVSFTEVKKGRALIADEMGLGKTVQALAWLQLHPNLRPAIVVCPATLKGNWKIEARKWIQNPRAIVLAGRKAAKPKGDIWIINYDVLPYWTNVLSKLNPKVIILDEAHYIKNIQARRTRAVKRLAKNIEHIIGLSGTALLNRPLEIYNIVNLIDPTLFPSRKEFMERYCDAKYNGFGWDYSGSSNTLELHRILTNSIMIRRLKSEVLKELPPKTFTTLPMDINNKKEYRYAETSFLDYCRDKFTNEITKVENAVQKELTAFMKANNIQAEINTQIIDSDKVEELCEIKLSKLESPTVAALVQLGELRRLAAKGKLNLCIEWIRNFLEGDKKLVVMAIHKDIVDALMQAFPKISVKIDGRVPVNKRHTIVQEFQTNKKIRLFVGNIKAAGEGITLTAASDILILEWPWSPGLVDQAVDRIHRWTQKFPVTVYQPIAIDTIEEKLLRIIETKRRVLASVLDGKEAHVTSMLSDILKEYSII